MSSRLLLGRNIVAVSFLDPLQTLVFLPALLNETTGDKILQFFVGAKAEHFFSAAHGVALLQPIVDELKKVVKPEELVVCAEHVHQFIGDVIRKST